MEANYDVILEANNDITNSIGKQKKDAKEIIENSLPTFIATNNKSGTIVTEGLVRLDLQGLFNNKNGIRYANLQIQLNKTRLDTQGREVEEREEAIAVAEFGKPKSTTIAIVLMPCGEVIPENIMKKAFNCSLDDRKKATIIKNSIQEIDA